MKQTQQSMSDDITNDLTIEIVQELEQFSKLLKSDANRYTGADSFVAENLIKRAQKVDKLARNIVCQSVNK